ncbi:MAG: cytochrome c3 family protein [Planctomycetaceae bacterium]
MKKYVAAIILCVGLFFGLIVLASSSRNLRLPDNQQGYAPPQPISFSHRRHAGELQIHCRFCHTGADKSRHAGIPSSDVCMKCHRLVTAAIADIQNENTLAKNEKRNPRPIISPELRKLYDSLGLGDDLKPADGKRPKSIAWKRVHDLPDYVYFDHRAHVTAGVKCQTCHGPVESMERMRQHSTLSMGWCVNCHRRSNRHGIEGRAVHASNDCATCHH